jgi:phage terminase small subunit
LALNPKQQAFVREYLVDLNATQAAIRVGYSAKTAKQQGSRLLTVVDVAKAIAAATERATKDNDITVSEIVEGLTSEARGADSASARVQAWGLLGKYKKMFVERLEHAGADGEALSVSININRGKK